MRYATPKPIAIGAAMLLRVDRAPLAPPAPAPAPAPAAQQATSKDDSIARAVAYKGAIDLVAKKIGPKDVLLKCTDTVNALTDSFESILQRKYSQGSGDDAQLEVVDAGQDTLFDTDNPI